MQTLGAYLLKRLYDEGVRQLYGIPGDFALSFFRCVEQFKKIPIITLSHEPSVGFAADATSRATGKISACAITYGAGGFNMVNPIACAYAEKSPVVVISGAPGLEERKRGYLFHHQAKTLDSQLKVFKEVTVYQAVLDNPETAVFQIDTALQMAKAYSRPVYIEIPRDKVFSPLPRQSPKKEIAKLKIQDDKEATLEVAQEISKLISKSKNPVLMIGIEVHRFTLQKLAIQLAEKIASPVVSSFMARCTFPIHHKQFAGIYLGPASPQKVQTLVEKSDCLILLGVPLADTDMAIRLKHINPQKVIHCVDREVSIGHHRYEHVSLQNLILKLLKTKTRKHSGTKLGPRPKAITFPQSYFGNQALKVEDIIHAVNFLFKLKGSMITAVDNGDCLFASTLLDTNQLLASGYYATMGFAVPSGMAVQISTGKRPLILVGDGAFQMTGPEISHCNKMGINPIVIVFNNRRWEMLTVIQPEGKYYDLTPWPFAKLAENWGGKGYTVNTRKEMLDAVLDAYKQKNFTIIDAQTPMGQRSKILETYLAKVRG